MLKANILHFIESQFFEDIMSESIVSSLLFSIKQITIYFGLTIVVAGVLGGCLNIIVFLSLRTFRQNSCSFYLTIMSILNIGELLVDLLPRILLAIYNTDGTETSLFYCKFRLYLVQICTLLSLTCFCLATFDQYCATCSRQRLQKFCNMKFARRLVIIFGCIWILHGIPYLIFFQHILSPITRKVNCSMVHPIFLQYRIYVIVLILFGILPLVITISFGSLAFYNTRQIPHYTIPLLRRELDKQLTTMVLLQIFMNIFTLLPYTIVNMISLNMKTIDDPLLQAQVQLRSIITLLLYYVYYAVSDLEFNFFFFLYHLYL
uniref:Thyrotropin-releasing hormone receptor 2-like protein n=1 Tax=Adineta vaga TaxID=104782 RepID=B3G443_ADIVA|nr:thyrotropin-releasing hormone receptor 2-like protein [Adineta vaga]